VGVVDAKDAYAVVDPEVEDLLARLPQRHAVGVLVGPEVQRVDVLVLLGRVLGVLDRAVRPVVEPLRVLGDPGVVGRALQRVVERHLEPDGVGLGDEPVEVVDGAELRVHRRVATLVGTDGPWAAGVVGVGGEGVVATLAKRLADGMDGRQVDDVEAHLGDGGQPLHRSFEPAFRAGEQLVPRAGARPMPIDPQRMRALDGEVGAIGYACQQEGDVLVEAGVEPDGARAVLGAQPGRGGGEAVAGLGRSVGGQSFDEEGALLQLGLDVVAGRHLDLDVVAPRGEAIGPRLDHQLVHPDGLGLEHPFPAIVADMGERGRPLLLTST
jgi:hypothetical protein